MTGPKSAGDDLQQKIENLWLDDPVQPVEQGYENLLEGLKRLATEEAGHIKDTVP
jgi:hypothetical protein